MINCKSHRLRDKYMKHNIS